MVTQPRSMARGHREGPRARGLLRLDTARAPVPLSSPPSCPGVLSTEVGQGPCMLTPGGGAIGTL